MTSGAIAALLSSLAHAAVWVTPAKDAAPVLANDNTTWAEPHGLALPDDQFTISIWPIWEAPAEFCFHDIADPDPYCYQNKTAISINTRADPDAPNRSSGGTVPNPLDDLNDWYIQYRELDCAIDNKEVDRRAEQHFVIHDGAWSQGKDLPGPPSEELEKFIYSEGQFRGLYVAPGHSCSLKEHDNNWDNLRIRYEEFYIDVPTELRKYEKAMHQNNYSVQLAARFTRCMDMQRYIKQDFDKLNKKNFWAEVVCWFPRDGKK